MHLAMSPLLSLSKFFSARANERMFLLFGIHKLKDSSAQEILPSHLAIHHLLMMFPLEHKFSIFDNHQRPNQSARVAVDTHLVKLLVINETTVPEKVVAPLHICEYGDEFLRCFGRASNHSIQEDESSLPKVSRKLRNSTENLHALFRCTSKTHSRRKSNDFGKTRSFL
ncbi:hypothetical protein [Brazilian marseillevirus]|uniref:hypothetical protein n=1 Tax=Brazilian marseillevirus TaxID=1813599 RepID=UPI0007804F91|nr:hypothetical protein A3303_gp046 [Brazilian marseillevirus]AMQ10554.1 hypothetical protein [Brazilian marseillevirus]